MQLGSSATAAAFELSATGEALLLTAAVMTVLAVLVWRSRGSAADRYLVVVLVATALWAGFYAAEITATSPDAVQLWGSLKYVGICALPPAWIGFVLAYTGRRTRLGWRLGALMSIEPAIVLGLLSMDRTDQLVRFYSETSGSSVPVAEAGPVFWVHLAYTGIVLWGGTVLLVVSLSRAPHALRRVTRLLVGSLLVPYVLNLLYNLQIAPFHEVDLTPFALLASAAVLVWGVWRVPMGDVQGVARSNVFELVSDPVVVLDLRHRVIDANPAALELFDTGLSDAVTRPLSEVAPEIAGALDEAGVAVGRHGEIHVAGKVYDVVASQLTDRRGHRSGTLLSAHDVTLRKAAEREYERRALHDTLTGLPNRELFLRRLRHAARDERGGVLGVLYVDVDRFKSINDTYGHRVGDDVLVEVARRLRSTIREGDTVARLGGDEFAVLIEDAGSGGDLLAAAQHVVNAMHTPMHLAGRRINVRVSVGVATGDEATSPDALLDLADDAMYSAKSGGRDRYVARPVLPRPRGAPPQSTPR